MTTLYRTPTQIIDSHEWHAAVEMRYGRVALIYRFRPLSARVHMWQSMSAWQGPKPKGMCDVFWRFRGHIREAMQYEQERVAALTGARKVPTGAQVRNPGVPGAASGKYALALSS